jgi:hypothetical protein
MIAPSAPHAVWATTLQRRRVNAVVELYNATLADLARCQCDRKRAEETAVVASGRVGRRVVWANSAEVGPRRAYWCLHRTEPGLWAAADPALTAAATEVADHPDLAAVWRRVDSSFAGCVYARLHPSIALSRNLRWAVPLMLREHLRLLAACVLCDHTGEGITQLRALVGLSRDCYAAWSDYDTIVLCPLPRHFAYVQPPLIEAV